MTSAEVLADVATWPADLRAEFEERAALISDGVPCSREESELAAWRLLNPRAVR